MVNMRFGKLGGEMISLPQMEAVLGRHFMAPAGQEGPVLAVDALEEEGQTVLVLFTTLPLEREQANAVLREEGLSALYMLRRVRRLAALPDSEADRLEEWAEKQERLDALNRAVERLDPEERALVTLFYYEDRSVGECAAITELSEGNVKVRLHRIRKKLYVLVNDEMNGTE